MTEEMQELARRLEAGELEWSEVDGAVTRGEARLPRGLVEVLQLMRGHMNPFFVAALIDYGLIPLRAPRRRSPPPPSSELSPSPSTARSPWRPAEDDSGLRGEAGWRGRGGSVPRGGWGRGRGTEGERGRGGWRGRGENATWGWRGRGRGRGMGGEGGPAPYEREAQYTPETHYDAAYEGEGGARGGPFARGPGSGRGHRGGRGRGRGERRGGRGAGRGYRRELPGSYQEPDPTEGAAVEAEEASGPTWASVARKAKEAAEEAAEEAKEETG